MKKTALYYHPIFLEHDNGFGHPERPERLTATLEALEEGSSCSRPDAEPAAASEETITQGAPPGPRRSGKGTGGGPRRRAPDMDTPRIPTLLRGRPLLRRRRRGRGDSHLYG